MKSAKTACVPCAILIIKIENHFPVALDIFVYLAEIAAEGIVFKLLRGINIITPHRIVLLIPVRINSTFASNNNRELIFKERFA